jgi:hypothetical protein
VDVLLRALVKAVQSLSEILERAQRPISIALPYAPLLPVVFREVFLDVGPITACGRICHGRREINVTQVFAGQNVGVKQTDDHVWLVTFMDLGYFDDETCRLEPIDNPFGPKVLPMSPQ